MVPLSLMCLVLLTGGSALTTPTRKMCWELICFGLYVDQNYDITGKKKKLSHVPFFFLRKNDSMSNHETDLMGWWHYHRRQQNHSGSSSSSRQGGLRQKWQWANQSCRLENRLLLMGCFSWTRTWSCAQKHFIHFAREIHHMDESDVQAVAMHYEF